MEILTIGHSNHTYEKFLEISRQVGVTAIADVRSSPFSKYMVRFNQDVLKPKLIADGIAYVFLGRELGGRPADQRYYRDGVADFELMATAPIFLRGIQRVLEGANHYRIALMCAEQDPLDCHRCLLVSRALKGQGARMRHIQATGDLVDHQDMERRLLEAERMSEGDLFSSPEEVLAEAYRRRARKAAFTQAG